VAGTPGAGLGQLPPLRPRGTDLHLPVPDLQEGAPREQGAPRSLTPASAAPPGRSPAPLSHPCPHLGFGKSGTRRRAAWSAADGSLSSPKGKCPGFTAGVPPRGSCPPLRARCPHLPRVGHRFLADRAVLRPAQWRRRATDERGDLPCSSSPTCVLTLARKLPSVTSTTQGAGCLVLFLRPSPFVWALGSSAALWQGAAGPWGALGMAGERGPEREEVAVWRTCTVSGSSHRAARPRCTEARITACDSMHSLSCASLCRSSSGSAASAAAN